MKEGIVMAGFIFSVSQDKWEEFCEENLKKGYFTPFAMPITEDDLSSRKRKSRNKVLSATFGDIVTMKPGDNIYFLSNRKIYGIGRAACIGEDCKYDNYLNASALLPDCQIAPTAYLTTANTQARWVFFFKPCPYLFKKGVDMDDVLKFRPYAFRMLRAFEGLSFIKVDDEENRALREYIALVNEPAYGNIEESTFPFDKRVHEQILSRNISELQLDINRSLRDEKNKPYVLSEMLIESALLQYLTRDTADVFGHWDHVTHQLIASPFKPLKYIDKIDIFGYRFSKHYQEEPRLITKYLLVELKKGTVDRAALEQTMQYVDWVCNEYAAGDYSKIEAYVVGVRVARDISSAINDVCQRSFITETHPVHPEKWNNIKIVKYRIDERIRFELYEL